MTTAPKFKLKPGVTAVVLAHMVSKDPTYWQLSLAVTQEVGLEDRVFLVSLIYHNNEFWIMTQEAYPQRGDDIFSIAEYVSDWHLCDFETSLGRLL
jgi:hypothetical protein